MYYEEEIDLININKPNIKLNEKEELEDEGELEKNTIVLDYNEYVTQIDMYKTDNNTNKNQNHVTFLAFPKSQCGCQKKTCVTVSENTETNRKRNLRSSTTEARLGLEF